MKNQYEIRGDTTVIYAFCKGVKYDVLIDTSDLPKLKKLNHTLRVMYDTRSWNCVTWSKGRKAILLHRYLLNPPDGLLVDHRDGNTMNNKRNNLRIVTYAENRQNPTRLARNNTSGHIGVHWNKSSNTWRSVIVVHGVRIELGSFKDKYTAVKARKEAEKRFHPYGFVLREAA